MNKGEKFVFYIRFWNSFYWPGYDLEIFTDINPKMTTLYEKNLKKTFHEAKSSLIQSYFILYSDIYMTSLIEYVTTFYSRAFCT